MAGNSFVNARRWLLIILLAYSLLGVAYSWVVPLGESPDEIDHFLYVRHLIKRREFPVMQSSAAENETMEANQPPLFYLLNAAVTTPFPMTASADLPRNDCFTFDPHDGGRTNFYLHDVAEQDPLAGAYLAFRVARILSVVQGAVTIMLVYGLGRQLVPGDESAALLGAATLAFNPQYIFITASVNNDVLTAVLGAAIVYLSVSAVNRPTLGRFVGLGVLVGLALLTKVALLALWPLPILAALFVAAKGQHKLAVQAGAVLFILPLLTAGWWYVRATLLYGDPLAWEVHLLAKGTEVLRTTPFTWADGLTFIRVHFQSYWAWFGWLKIQAPSWVYGLLAVGSAVSGFGMAYVIKDWRLKIEDWRIFGCLSAFFPVSPTAFLFNTLALGAIYAALLRYIQTINWSGYQGRLAYAVAAPAAALLGLGWWRIALMVADHQVKPSQSASSNHYLSAILLSMPATGLLLLSIASLGQLSASFDRPALFTPAASWHRVCIDTPIGFYVEAVDLPAAVLPGEELPVALAGYGLSVGEAAAELSLLDWDETVLATSVTDLAWTKNEPVSMTQSLTVPPAVLPARGRLRLRLADEAYGLQIVKIRPLRPVSAVPSQQIEANFNDELSLLGYDLQPDGGDLRLTTYWRTLTPLSIDYTIFVHLLDDTGQLIVQHDAQPQGGRYPTTIWDVGEIVVDEITLTLPSASQAAQIAVGLYRPDTLVRLPLEESGETVVLLPMNK